MISRTEQSSKNIGGEIEANGRRKINRRFKIQRAAKVLIAEVERIRSEGSNERAQQMDYRSSCAAMKSS